MLKIRITFVLCLILLMSTHIFAQDASGGLGAPSPDRPVGLNVTSDTVQDGYILVPIIQSKDILLYDNDGNVVHTWTGDTYTGASVYLNAEGNLVRTVSLDDNFGFGFNGQWGFVNGAIEEVNWDGEVI